MLASSSTRRVRTGAVMVASLLVVASSSHGRGGLARARELDGEGGAAVHLAAHLNVALVALDHGVHDRQAEPGSLPRFLGGEKRVEDVLEVLRGNADAGVGKFELD